MSDVSVVTLATFATAFGLTSKRDVGAGSVNRLMLFTTAAVGAADWSFTTVSAALSVPATTRLAVSASVMFPVMLMTPPVWTISPLSFRTPPKTVRPSS